MAKIVKGCFVCLFVLALSTVAFAQSTTTGSVGGVIASIVGLVKPENR